MAPPSGGLLSTTVGSEQFPEFSRGLVEEAAEFLWNENPLSKMLFSGKLKGQVQTYDSAAQLEKLDRISTRSNITTVINGTERPVSMTGALRTRHRVFPEAPLFKGELTVTYGEVTDWSIAAEKGRGGEKSIRFINSIVNFLADSQEDLRRRMTRWFVRGSLQSDPEEADAAVIAEEAANYASIAQMFTLWGGNATIGLKTWNPTHRLSIAHGGLLQFQAPASQTGYYAGLYRKGDGSADALESKYWYNQYQNVPGIHDLANALRKMRIDMKRIPRYSQYGFPTMALADNQTVGQLLEYHKSRIVAIGQNAEYQTVDQNLYGDIDTSFAMPLEGGGKLDVMVPQELSWETDADIRTLKGVMMLPNIKTFISIASWQKIERLMKSMGIPWMNTVEDLNTRAFAMSDFFQANLLEEVWTSRWFLSDMFMAEELAFNGCISGTVNADAT
jgi:hypothetical protein